MNSFFLDPKQSSQGSKMAMPRKISLNAPAQSRTSSQSDFRDGDMRKVLQQNDKNFLQVYQKTAHANKRAQVAAQEQAVDNRGSERGGDVNPVDPVTQALVAGTQVPDASEPSTAVDIDSLLEQVLGEDGLQSLAGQQNSEGWQLIRDALAKVSDQLHLNLVGQLDQLSMDNPDGFVIQQFADIVQTLKSIAGVLDNAAVNNEALNMRGQTIEPAQALELQKSLATETFRIELGLKMIGIGSDVAQQVAGQAAQQGQELVVASEIPTAVKPSSISQSNAQLNKIFSGLIDESQEHIKAIVAKMALTAASGKTPAGEVAAQNVPEVIAQNQEAQKPADVSAFHTSVMRKLLKIDGGAAKDESGALASGTDGKLSLADAVATTPAAAKSAQELAEMLSKSSESAIAGMGDRGAAHLPLNDIAAKPAALSYRSIDESVMQQIIDRMHSTVRGSGVGQQEIRIHLRPEALGEVHLKIQMDGDIVMAKIHVESQQVKQIVESHLQSLRNALQEHNLQAGSLDVSVGQDGDHRNQMAEQSAGGRKGHGASIDSTESVEADGAQIVFGQDTGRRYGENSFEYLA